MKNILTIIVAVLVVWLYTYNCSGQIDDSERLEQLEKIDSLAFLRQKEKDSLNKEIDSLKQTVLKSEQTITSLETEIEKRKQQAKKDKERIKNLNLIEVANELNTIYNTTDAIASDVSVNLNGSLPNRVLETIYEADECQDVLVLKDSVIFEKDIIIGAKDGEIKNLSLMFFSAEKEIEEREKYQKIAEDNIKNLQRKNKNSKYYIIGSFVGGVILGTQLVR